MKVILTGGGTLGPVMPLLALVDAIKSKKSDTEFLWIGTRSGPEKILIREKGIEFKAIFSGKWRRYFSLRNFLDFILIKLGCAQAFAILLSWKPDVIVSAGGFVAVPVVYSGWLLRIPVVIHQQDVQPGLANKLCAPFAKKTTTAFEKSLKDFNQKKTKWIGNPVREEIVNIGTEHASSLPIVLVIGGSTGSKFINDLVFDALPELTKFCEVIHTTGGKIKHREQDRYHPYVFLGKDLPGVYSTADVVVSRAGMGVLTELSALGKSSILIPLPGHQEKNAEYFDEKDAATILNQKDLNEEIFIKEIKKLLEDRGLQRKLEGNIKKIFPRGAAEKLAEVVLSCQK